jgi:Protein of unknown function (DUF1552)
MTNIRRRSFLAGVGAGTAALLGGSFQRNAFGQGAVPKRLLVLLMPNSSIRANWVPKGGRIVGGSGDATQFTFGSANSTLMPVRSLATIVDGLDLPNIGGDPHGSGIIRLVTGGTIRAGEKAKDPGAGKLPDGGNQPVMPSIDQVLADKAMALKGTRYTSLQIAGDSRADNGRTDDHLRVMSYDLKLNPLFPQLEPTKTFGELFKGISTEKADPAAIQLAMEQEGSVLDFLKGDLARLSAQLPADQRPKLDSHLDAIRELEASLQAPSLGAGITIPAPPDAVAPNVSANHSKLLSQYFALVKLAFQLDLTRVVTFMFATGNSQVVLPNISGLTTGIHPTAHNYAAAPLTLVTAWYCDVVAKFLTDLQTAKESDGSNVLDNTIVVLSSEVGQYHEHNNIPFVLFGGSKLGLKGGRCLHYSGRSPNDVWTAIASALGAPIASFGDAAYNQGPLPELFG